ncbi:lysophospholipid acyltransferase family protein [Mycobacterium sp.]|uniref:lysophospholipid acyltransferase family protein n=1 Tax=Mycobacterium sp. TaxID=1785 RepID=UPI003F9A70D2
MTSTDIVAPEIEKWDPILTERVMGVIRPLLKRYFRSEVHGLENVPAGGALVVSNHSGGQMAFDVPIFAVDWYAERGYERPIYTLSHDMITVGPIGSFLRRIGFIPANHDNAASALRSDGIVVVFPGGDYDAYRPTLTRNVIDFGGRTGYVRAAIEAGVPIVPMVSVGGQETQLFITRGSWLARRLGAIARLGRAKIVPVTVGFPFGVSLFVLPPNLPLPAKIVTQVLEPINIRKKFGKNPDIAEVDAYVRQVMQAGLDELAAARRFPVLG